MSSKINYSTKLTNRHEIKFSVVIPTYNHSDFLGKSLQSVLDQTYTNWEALVIDNYSDDATETVVRSFSDSRIKYLKLHNFGVIAKSRNYGVLNANGDWIAFLDSDDIWYPTKLQIIFENLYYENHYDVYCSNELMVNLESGVNKVLHHGPFSKEFYKSLLLYGNRLSTSATIVRRDFLVNNRILFNESVDFITVEDYAFWLDIALRGGRFKFIQVVLGEYTIHGENSSGRIQRHWESLEKLLHWHVFNIQNFDSDRIRLWKKISVRIKMIYVRELFKRNQVIASFKLFARIFCISPMYTITLFLIKYKSSLTKNLLD